MSESVSGMSHSYFQLSPPILEMYKRSLQQYSVTLDMNYHGVLSKFILPFPLEGNISNAVYTVLHTMWRSYYCDITVF